MAITPNAEDLKQLLRLLDRAIDIPPQSMAAWIDGLPAEVQHLAPRLRRLLQEHHAGSCVDFLAGLPRLDDGPADTLAQPGGMVGPYRLLREVGQGGMCTVWLAERDDADGPHQFAVKLPRRGQWTDLVQRMATERDITVQMVHPHVARLRDAGHACDGRPYLVLDHVDGRPLDQWCRDRRLGTNDRLCLFLQVVHAVAHVHSLGVVHRDLKPANVLVDEQGHVKLLDFGIACRLRTSEGAEPASPGERSMTLGYAPLEQRRGTAPDAFTVDIYALGAMLFELLTGELPRGRMSSGMAEVDALDADLSPPLASSRATDPRAARRLQGAIDALLCKALSHQPQQRQATALALAADIRSCLAQAPAALSARMAASRAIRLVISNDPEIRLRRHSAVRRGATRRPCQAKASHPAIHGPMPSGRRMNHALRHD